MARHPLSAVARLKLQDLPEDIWLDHILPKLDTESLLLSAPFVCSTWRHATLSSPSLWSHLAFPSPTPPKSMWAFPTSPPSSPADEESDERLRFDYFTRKFAREFHIPWDHFSLSKLVNLAITRSRGGARSLALPGICSHYTFLLREVLEHVAITCHGFEEFSMAYGVVDCELAKDIVRNVGPRIRKLCLRNARIGRKEVVGLIEGCRELEVLDLRGCVGFAEKDEEIARIGRRIREFRVEGSRSEGPPRAWEYAANVNANAGVVHID